MRKRQQKMTKKVLYKHINSVETLRAEPVAPFHFTSFARRPSGEFPFTHGQARGTLPFGLVEKLKIKKQISKIQCKNQK
jgi:hypothetical protein